MEPAFVLLFLLFLRVSGDTTAGTSDGTEEWGYVDVRPGAHLFWWLYYNQLPSSASVPLILWLQGGPGASGAGFGNFEEIGPLTTQLEKRESTWLKTAHLLFVDNPVGTGFSYVDDELLLTKNNKEVADDLIQFLDFFFKHHSSLQRAPFYIVAESYGGKYASEVGVIVSKKLAEGSLDFNFQGVALGDTWISPIDFLLAWGPLLKSFSLVDDTGASILNRISRTAQEEINKGNFMNATNIWSNMEIEVMDLTDNVNFYNLLQHEPMDSLYSVGLSHVMARHLRVTEPLERVMNGEIRQKLRIIPDLVRWAESSSAVFQALAGDFMKDTIDKVDELLELGVKVVIYSGQLDLICCTTGTEAWLRKLKWSGLSEFYLAQRKPLYCEDSTAAFHQKYSNLEFYWIMNAGHMVPTDNPCMALKMLGLIVNEQEHLIQHKKRN